MEDKYCNNCQRHISALNFATHSAYCERNIKVCKMCNEPIPVSDERNHLEEFHINISCNLCGTSLEKWMLSKHQESCIKRPVTCKYCDGEFPCIDYSEHFEFCSSRTEKCLQCQKYVMLKDKQKHSEFHLYERKILQSKIDNEEEQNIINEVISNSAADENIKVQNYNISSEKVTAEKYNIQVPEGANASACDVTKEMSKHYTICHICKQTIPWIDMNIHVPNCASDAGKCSRCGEDVPNHEIKQHILRTCKMLSTEASAANKTDLRREKMNRNEAFYVAEMDIDEQDMKSCTYCKQLCSSDRINEHMKNCWENCYECPMCNSKILEKDKVQHETFSCKKLLESNMLYSTLSASENTHDKYKNTPNMIKCSKDEITEEESNSLHNTNRSYADATRKSYFQEKEKKSSKCEPCCPCYKNSKHEMQHSHVCQQNLKGLESTNEREYKEAVPKNTRFANMVNPKRMKCKFCSDIFPPDMVLYHEKLCIHQLVMCEECHDQFTLEELQYHICKRNKSQDSTLESTHEREYKGAVPKNSRVANMVKPQKVRCKFCSAIFHPDIVFQHEEVCLHQPVTCEECNVRFPLEKLQYHNCKSKKGRRGKPEKHQVKTESNSSFGGRLQNIFGRQRDSDNYTEAHFENSSGYNYNKSSFSYPDTNDVEIPCEFCGRLFSASEIILHQTGCEPDLVGVPKNNSQKESTTESAISTKQTNLFQQNSVTEEKFFSFENKANVLARRSQDVKKYTDLSVKPGEFLQTEYSKASETSENHETGEIDYHSSPSIQSVWNVTQRTAERLENPKPKKQLENENSDEEMSEMLEFINEGESNATDKRISNTSNVTSDENLCSQRCHEDKPENKKSFTKSAENLYKEAWEILSKIDNENFDLTGIKEYLPDNSSENKRKQAFMVEPVKDHSLKPTSVRKIKKLQPYVGSNEDVHSSSDESYFETAEDLEKWEKWQS